MQDVVLSLTKNILKLTSISKVDLKTVSSEISLSVVNDTKIIDPDAFSTIVQSLLPQVYDNNKKIALNFIAEPNDVLMRFVTVPKKNSSNEDDIFTEIKDKNTDIDFDNLYFSYEKIAPFVYQFIAVKKDYLENVLKVSDILGMPLRTITPWVSVLPTFVKTCDPAIFIYRNKDSDTIALSEMGGIFFCGEYPVEKEAENIKKVVKELSVYKRTKPINNIYTVNDIPNDFGEEYKVSALDFGPKDKALISGYETNLIAHFTIDNEKDFVSSQLNVVNLMPVPTVERKPLALAKITTSLALTTLIALLIFGGISIFTKGKTDGTGNIAGVVESTQSDVLSTEDGFKESTQTETPIADLKKADISIRVENGSGINGIAAKTKTLLEGLGYKVTEIDTAPETRDTTLLRFKNSKLNYSSMLVGDMKESYGEPAIESSLDEASGYDLLIIIGKNVSL